MKRFLEYLRRWSHGVLGWGYPGIRIGGDWFQPTYSCRYCNKSIAKDSQGNWFHL